MQKRYAVVVDGKVEQIVLWDKDNPSAALWKPVVGVAVECPEDLHLGATYDGQDFTQPPQKPSGQAEQVGQDNLTDDERAKLKQLIAKSHGS